MSLHPRQPESVPDRTARVAQAAFPHSSLYIRIRDELGPIFADEQFAHLFPRRGQPAESPWRLALVMIFQFLEHLSDRRAADAVRSRIDWKYALSLELEDAGFDHTVLSEFRSRLVASGAEQLLLDVLLEHLRGAGLLKPGGRQRTDSTHLLAAVRALNRYELVGESLRQALESLALAAPDWLRTHAQPEWVERYARRAEDDRLPEKEAQRQKLAETIGADGARLLTAVSSASAPPWLRELPAVQLLRQVWVPQYVAQKEKLRLRTEEDGRPPSAKLISSPYDPDARSCRKRTTSWVGYKVQLTETCGEEGPTPITNGETTSATTADGEATSRMHQQLACRDLLPSIHLVDTGFLDAELLVDSRRNSGVELWGPTRRSRRWQARADAGLGVEHFAVDWDRCKAVCPKGHESRDWMPRVDPRGNASSYIRLSPVDCGPCPSRSTCTQAKAARRSLAIRPRDQYEALEARRRYEATEAYVKIYALRAGAESTLSEGSRALGLRRTRSIGLARTISGMWPRRWRSTFSALVSGSSAPSVLRRDSPGSSSL